MRIALPESAYWIGLLGTRLARLAPACIDLGP